MSEYHTEGFIKTVSSDGEDVKFTIEVVAPYLFEVKDKSTEPKRKMLIVSKDERNAKLYDESKEFKMTKMELTAMLIAKANHMKVRLSITHLKAPLQVVKFEVV